MTPTLVTDRDGKAVAAFGGQGGRMIPNGTFDALLHYVAGGRGLVEALEAPRLHTVGDKQLRLEAPTAEEKGRLEAAGYAVAEGGGFARISAVEFDAATGRCLGASR